VLGICRGAQVLNIARGGNLHQHLPDQVGERMVHRQPGPIARPTHTVRMAEGSMLRRVMDRAWAWENSLHHQAVARVGAGLRPVAWALDGTVEAIEGDGDGAGFALGVQWHVEALLTRPEHLAVIEALVGAGRAARDERPRRAA
jgi:gamma-glutamyl-gamma-aminobutyrate hydrolase PuuD